MYFARAAFADMDLVYSW